MAPIVPGFSSSRSKLERTVKAIADHGARFVGCNVMYLQDGTRSHFMKFVEQEFPSMRPRFERLYVGKYPPEAYRKEIQSMVRLLQQRHGLIGREDRRNEDRKNKDKDAERGREQEGASGAEQVGFAW
jgi:DNA repair photolyase